MKTVLVCGARPNFMKIAPIIRAINRHNVSARSNRIEPLLVHTGQHYDYEMSQVFFQDLELPRPDIYLGVGSGTHGEQTGKVMIELEKVLLEEKPDIVVVVGDVNSTLAAALAAVKLHIAVAHVEAGLRSYDRTMPEEINRLLTDQVSDYLFTPSRDADENLKREGIPPEKIFFVGNVMIDSLLYNRTLAEKSDILQRLGLITNHQTPVTDYALLTLHRPSNVDEKDSLADIMTAITRISQRIPVVFPAHPRTRKKLEEFGLLDQSRVTIHQSMLPGSQSPITNHQLLLVPPLSYLDFLKLEMYAEFVMTDSGGIQEETTVLNVPCLTLRDTTERPITITQGTNVLTGNSPGRIIEEAFRILATSPVIPRSPAAIGTTKQSQPQSESDLNKLPSPPLWDGKAADRIVEILAGRRHNL